jgi:hypothetical protein
MASLSKIRVTASLSNVTQGSTPVGIYVVLVVVVLLEVELELVELAVVLAVDDVDVVVLMVLTVLGRCSSPRSRCGAESTGS